jgi:hypothetical protein
MNELADIISQNEEKIRVDWIRDMGNAIQRADLIGKDELEEQCRALLSAIVTGIRSTNAVDISSAGWTSAREFLQQISSSRARQGFAPSDVAMFVLSLKRPMFVAIRRALASKQDALFDTIWTATELLDQLAPDYKRCLYGDPGGTHLAPAGGTAGAVDAGRQTVGWHSRFADHWDARQRPDAGGDGEPAAGGGCNEFKIRNHRHHGGSHRGHAGGATPVEDYYGVAPDGG